MPQKLSSEKLAEICEYILKGMSEKEACILSSFPYSDYLIARDEFEEVSRLVEQTKVRFKYVHIDQIQKSKSDKNSMYLLEKLRSEEFGPKSKSEGPTINIISAAIREIQNDNNSPIILKPQTRGEQLGSDEQPKPMEAIAALN